MFKSVSAKDQIQTLGVFIVLAPMFADNNNYYVVIPVTLIGLLVFLFANPIAMRLKKGDK